MEDVLHDTNKEYIFTKFILILKTLQYQETLLYVFHKFRFISYSNITFPSARNNFKTRFISKCDLQFVTVILTVTINCLYFLFHAFHKNCCVLVFASHGLQNPFRFTKVFCGFTKTVLFVSCVSQKVLFCFSFTRFTKKIYTLEKRKYNFKKLFRTLYKKLLLHHVSGF